MDPDFTLKGSPRRWYAYPFVAGVILVAIGVVLLSVEASTLLTIAYFLFRVAVRLMALIGVCLGILLILIGLDLARGFSTWRPSDRVERCREWFHDRWRGSRDDDRP
ncbi:hypothetical protein JW916_11865 [Candidatus Sumerlaeota bacterium]|nr:hypothetical protein [Candidatus Sumerlaeota bacterium]